MEQSTKTRLPADIDEEDPFLVLAELKLSLRQMLMIMFSLVGWFLLMTLTADVLPIPKLLAGVMWSWVLIGGIVFALLKKNGRPLEFHFTDWVVFQISDHHWAAIEDRKLHGSIEEADWEEDDGNVYRW
jgi:hypothetical protein